MSSTSTIRKGRLNMKTVSVSILSVALLAGATLMPRPALAGPYTDDLSKCLVAQTTSDDKATLMTWIFSAISLNPGISKMANITPAQRHKINAEMARLFETLMTERCRAESQQAYKFEGESSIEAGFSVLGQVAGRELFNSPEVTGGMSELDTLIDKKKMESVFGKKK
jgi:hypothetical protein